MSQRAKRKFFIAAFIIPTLVFFCVFTLYPIFRGIYISFYDWSGSAKNMDFIGLDNFRELLKDPIIWTAIKNDYFLVVGKVIGILLLATLFAIAITRLNIRGSSFYRVIFFIPNIISVVVIGVLWRYVYNPNMGFINSFLTLFKGEQVQTAWLGQENTAMWSLLWPSIWAGIGFYMILLIAAILSIPSELYEAADLDGASQGRQFWSVTVPLIWEQMKVSILHIVMTTLNGSFIIVWIMTEGGPDNSTQVMGSYLYQMGFRQYHMGYAAAIGVLILILSFITTVVLQRLLRRETIELA
ncbi:carbohydrate ABC transporter permease [Paenibacillus radicis (ex Gao et al. 2016)]|uniref:ABC transporter permease n=1 Tax=Paenibacillus radicis (ex Gao et al. 2016) TaxID=1737354 RepID=A0A917H463_9BACL|nr:sugar ABC transporter permease [Paenibacillus radicis (ex Gao et al. 2016)]GGG66463.1 ABC transporter permease [Paenibacillus radicis (ex Gao et al. 2016)]